jgi:hypothetical protein
MKPRRLIIAAILVTLGIVAAILIADYRREPRYHGKRLSWWLKEGEREWSRGGEKAQRPAMEAVQHIGTNGIPTLLRMLRKTDSPLALKWQRLADNFDFLPRPLPAPQENQLGARGILWLGSDASSAIPELLGIYRKRFSASSEDSTFYCLRKVLPVSQFDALLQEGLTNQYDTARFKAYWQLTPVNTPQTSIPLLIKAMSDPSPRIQGICASKLREFGTNALPAIPALLPLAISGATNVNFFAARRTLMLIDPETSAKWLTNGGLTYQQFTNRNAPPGATVPTGGDAEATARFHARYGLPSPEPLMSHE